LFCQPFASYLRQNPSHAGARLGWPVVPGRSASRFGGSGPCIVKVEQQFSFAFLDKWIYFYICFFLITKLLRCYCLGGGAVAIAVIAYSYRTPEERRHTAKLGVSIGVPGRRDPG
jgi:hypothetical protein